jgi:membrane protease YdiL (CAAX protease family)
VNLALAWFGIKPTIHPLLEAVGQRPGPWLIAATLAAAVVSAPLAEEAFFRGIVQNFFARFFRVMMPPKGWPTMALSIKPPELCRLEAQEAIARARALGEQPPADLDAPPEPESAGGQARPLSPAQEGRRAIAAIILAGLVFAAVHPGTTIPAIFILGLALGYAYEVTGSLVCVITMHAAFNACNMALQLLDTWLRSA